ncbi:hypothetical protein ZWY2020_048846 [Hordeum vulgare]|nr:hypothetical protein ZWY2020_048846 [Hordeum vulgare]
MHNNDVLPPTQDLGEVSDRQIAHPLGLDGMSAQESAAYAKLKWFCSSLMKNLAPSLLKEVQASNLRAEAKPFTPRRCTRGSKKLLDHKSNKVSQAENVLMRAWGLVPDDLDVDDTVVTELQNIFDSLVGISMSGSSRHSSGKRCRPWMYWRRARPRRCLCFERLADSGV